MKPEVRKELDDLLTIAQNWIDTEVKLSDCDGTDQFVLDDFIEDISKQFVPYIRRLHQCEHITYAEYGDFLLQLKAKVNELRERLRLPENIQGTQ